MKKVLVDSDIILDLMLERNQFYTPAAELFNLIEKKKNELPRGKPRGI